ncbi:MAG: ATP-binding cassette domain-containing protein [Candidatus Gracilibacteria bacterium]|nr:ATP-binding cassette domain-containing protein [Candidatus Gracilibacteria bacterium]
MIQFQSISHSFGPRLVISHLDAEVGKGQMCVVTGRNGSGKSTLINMLLGKSTPTSGQMLLDGRSLKDLNKADREKFFGVTGVVAQNIFPRPTQTVLQVLETHHPNEEQMKNMLVFLDMQGRENELISSLSISERRRVDLGRSLIHSPKMVIWDDPFCHFDQLWTERFTEELKHRNHEGLTIVITSSDMKDIEHLYPEVVIKL